MCSHIHLYSHKKSLVSLACRYLPRDNMSKCDGQVEGIQDTGPRTAISALDFSSTALTLAIGHQCGQVISIMFSDGCIFGKLVTPSVHNLLILFVCVGLCL